MRIGRKERAVRAEVDRLVEEAGAMLAGQLCQRCDPGEASACVRVNELAHADWDRLTGIADGRDPLRRSAWDGATRFLAAEMVSSSTCWRGDPRRPAPRNSFKWYETAWPDRDDARPIPAPAEAPPWGTGA